MAAITKMRESYDQYKQ